MPAVATNNSAWRALAFPIDMKHLHCAPRQRAADEKAPAYSDYFFNGLLVQAAPHLARRGVGDGNTGN